DDALAREVALLLGAENRSAVPTGVVERLQPFVVYQDDALRADLHDAPVAPHGQLFFARDRDPLRVPERLELAIVMRRIGIPGGRQPGFEAFERLATQRYFVAFRR